MSGNKSFKNPFSSGLGKGGRAGAWFFAIGAVVAYNYFENKSNGEAFTLNELKDWNKDKKGSDNSK